MADWSRAYSARWRVRRVDPETWECVSEVGGITSATVTRGDGDEQESGSFELMLAPTEPLDGGWVRIEAVVEQDGGTEVVEVATLLLSEGSATFARGMRSVMASGASVLHQASARVMRGGAYAPRGADGAAWVADLLSGCIDAPVSADGAFQLSDHVVFKSGQTFLSAARQVLAAAGWRLRIDGRGEVTVCPPASETSLDVTPSNVCDGVTVDASLADVPNVYVAVEGASVATATNADPASRTSTASRGYVVERLDKSPKRVDGESLQDYAERRLTEARVAAVRTYSWTRDFAPDVVTGDLVRAVVPSAGIDATLRVTSQTLTCGAGLMVEESAALEEVV